MKDVSNHESFEELDALLDQAYALNTAERAAFVAQLPEPVKGRIEQLLEVSNALTLQQIAEQAQNALLDPGGSGAAATSSTAGPWRLHRALGSGGMGQVFFATREAPESGAERDYVQHAAVKVLWSEQANEEVRARFLRERRLLATLSHPGLARFVDGGFLEDGRPWFAMEYVAGKNIDSYAQKLSLDERLQLFMEVCATVAYAHQRLIVHRDIKPANILVDEEGRARLLDFGIAGVLEDIDDGVRTRTSGGPLTLQYASPEQLSGGVVTASSDIYQLGLLLYEMLAGQRPYDLREASLMRALEAICERIPPRPSTHNIDIRPDLEAIVMSALAKDPDDRYKSVTAFADDIGRFREGLPVRALPQTSWYVARRFLRRHAVVTGIVTLCILALSMATGVSIWMAHEATAQAARSHAAQQILSDVFKKADPFNGKGATVTLADALVRAKPEIAVRLQEDPLLAWEVNRTLAKIYEGLGLVEEERTSYEAMLVAAEQLGGSKNNYRHLLARAGIGNVLARTNPVEAVIYFDTHLPVRPSSKKVLNAWLDAQYAYVGALSRVREFGRADTGTYVMAEVMEAFAVTAPRKRGRLSQLLAQVAQRAGDRDAEDQHRKDAVEAMRAAGNPSALAVILNNYAIHLGRRGRYQASEGAFQEALAIFEGAEIQDPTFATVLRSYAGLLFRTDRVEEAISATEKSLSLLSPTTQFYARFVAELNLAQFSFVHGDGRATLDVMLRALPAALEVFDDDPAVPKRMLRLFVKTLSFGGAGDLARIALGAEPSACRKPEAWAQAVASLEPAKDRAPREALEKALEALGAKQGPPSEADLETVAQLYAEHKPLFFDAYDRWRMLERLEATGAQLPSVFLKERKTLKRERAALRKALKTQTAAVRDLARALGAVSTREFKCPTGT